MSHRITAIILKGKYSKEKAKEYDLIPIHLNDELTMFFINHYYTEYWQYEVFKKRNNLDLNLDKCPITFPTEEVTAFIMEYISLENALFSIIFTDYFGGVGEQFACVFKGYINQYKSITCINEALKLLGVKGKEGFDEFDTIGLSKFRSEPDCLEKYYSIMDDIKF